MQYVEAVVVTDRHCYSFTNLQLNFGIQIKRALYFLAIPVLSDCFLLQCVNDGLIMPTDFATRWIYSE